MPSRPDSREARLRPEFAQLYPGLEPGVWLPASEVAVGVVARVIQLETRDLELENRVLDDRHFEFRGRTTHSGETAEHRRMVRDILRPPPTGRPKG